MNDRAPRWPRLWRLAALLSANAHRVGDDDRIIHSNPQFDRGQPDQPDMRVEVEFDEKINIAVPLRLAARRRTE